MAVGDPRGESGRRRPVAIIDIGSNSIRLVVYDGRLRSPVPLFNEKAVCALGHGLEGDGRLNPEGVPAALSALGRFVALARAMPAVRLVMLATSAVRDARNGPEFVATIEQTLGVKVDVISGESEARYSALGVLYGTPDADGLMADLGGGSLELQTIDRGKLGGDSATLPLGVIRLADAAAADLGEAERRITALMAPLTWLPRAQDRSLYAVGGSWRALARLLIDQTGHPLHVIDNFTLERADATRLLDLFVRLSARSLEKIPGVSRKRAPFIALSALVLARLIEKARPARLIFSATGLREGAFFEQLAPTRRGEDPMLAACAAMAREVGRFPNHADELMAWMEPLFPGESPALARRRRAACLLGDLFWSEHPDYRAEQAFLRVIRAPAPGFGHGDRVSLALALHARYQGNEDLPELINALRLLPEEEQRQARLVGHLLRLANSVSGGVPGLLPNTRLRRQGDALVFEMARNDPVFAPGSFERRFDRLARAAGAERLELAWV